MSTAIISGGGARCDECHELDIMKRIESSDDVSAVYITSSDRSSPSTGEYSMWNLPLMWQRNDQVQRIRDCDAVIFDGLRLEKCLRNPNGPQTKDWEQMLVCFKLVSRNRKSIIFMNVLTCVLEPLRAALPCYDEFAFDGAARHLVLKDDFYDACVLHAMNGNSEVLGYEGVDGLAEIVGDQQRVYGVAQWLDGIKDVLELNTSYENLVSLLVNMPDDVRVSMLMLNTPLVESNVSLGDDHLVDKTYWYMNIDQWETLMHAVTVARRPVAFVYDWEHREHVPKQILGKFSLSVVVPRYSNLFLHVARGYQMVQSFGRIDEARKSNACNPKGVMV